jgi:nitroreductase
VDTYLAVASKRDWRSYSDAPIPDELVTRILDGGRLAGSAQNKQPWTFVVVADRDNVDRLAEAVYEPRNLRTAALAVAIVSAATGALDIGRAMQNMMLVAWNDGVVSCPNGLQDADRAAEVLGLSGDERAVNIPSFAYPLRPLDPESRSAAEWSEEANRKPLDEVVRRV